MRAACRTRATRDASPSDRPHSRQDHPAMRIFWVFCGLPFDHNDLRKRLAPTRAAGRYSMSCRSMPRIAGLILGILVMSNGSACADALKDEIAPTGKLRVE